MEEYAWKQRRFFLFSHPRTMSNLLGRILESAPELDQCSYNFQDASMFIRGLLEKWTLDEINDESWSKHTDLMEKGHASLQASILEAGQKVLRHGPLINTKLQTADSVIETPYLDQEPCLPGVSCSARILLRWRLETRFKPDNLLGRRNAFLAPFNYDSTSYIDI